MEEGNEWCPRVLVIGPGGIKGLKILGFLIPLEESSLLKYVDTYCGVSVGAMICLLMIAGYNIREIIGEASRFNLFKDLEFVDLHEIFSKRGLISNEPIRKRLTELILNKFGTVPTLYNLYMQTGKSFITVTLNATDEKSEMMGPFTHGNISCVDATMCSMNIPFIFYQLMMNGKTYVDGALANPYPIDYFDNNSTNILGIYVSSSQNTFPLANNKESLSMILYISKIIHFVISQRRNENIQKCSNKCKNVKLVCKNFNPIGYSITIDEKAIMLVEGYNEGKSFLTQINKERSEQSVDNIMKQEIKYTYPTYFLKD